MPASAKRLLPVLLLLSGFCGISYEILYTKLLGNLLGNQFTISASVLLTFLLGIGLGTLYAHRFVRRLWAIEAGIGVYAAVMVLTYGWIDRFLYNQIPELGTSLVVCALISIGLLVIPAFLVGCSVPLFAAYLSTLRSTHVFSMTYGIYNFGAAITALTMEFVLLRMVGLKEATLWLAVLNAVVAAGLLVLVRSAPIVPPPQSARLWFPFRDLAALATASVASAVFQLMMIKVAECIFGPYNETFSLVLAVVLFGLGLGSFAAAKLRLTFSAALLVALGGLTLLLASLGWSTELYASAYPSMVKSYPSLVALKFGLVFMMMGLPAIGFGATIPTLLRVHRDVARESGQLLFVSSMGNVVGFVLMAFVLHRFLDYGPLLVVVAALTGVALVLHSGFRHGPAWVGIALVLAAVGAQQGLWSEVLLYYGHTNFHSTEDLESRKSNQFSATERFKGHQDVFAITRRNGNSYFFINGYVSIVLSNSSEKIVGGLSSMYAPRTDRAMVLGLGSGATAGTVGLIFDEVDVVEINPVVVANQWRMAEFSFDIENRESVNIVLDDGIHFVKTTPERYSLILNTVTTPLYFSSSKLYTRDFLESVASKLTPDGVYTTWIDRKIGDKGVDIILNTLESAFEHCWMNYLKSSYYLMACSNQELQLRQIEAVVNQSELRNYLAEEHYLPVDLIPYSVLSTDAFGLRADPNAPLNTIDFPVLEHEMARLDSEVRLVEFQERLAERLDLREVSRRLQPVMDWDPAGFALWSTLRLSPSNLLGEALDEVIPRQFGDLSEPLGQLAEQTAALVDEAPAYYKFGHRLFRRDEFRTAVPLLEKAAELEVDNYRAHHYLGASLEALGDPAAARRQYEKTLELKPDYKKSRRALERLRVRAGSADGSSPKPEEEADEPQDL